MEWRPNVVRKALDSTRTKSVHDIVTHAREQVETCVLGQNRDSAASSFPVIPGYEIVREIHRGGQGVVYEASQDHPHRRVAIKFLRDGIASSHTDRMRFHREADILARVRHPNIVTIHEAGVASGSQYFVMDYIAGLPLDEYIRYAASSVEDTVRLFATICDAVSAAHQHGVLHRDLKPSNIRVDEQGQPHVLDFGLAADIDGAHSSVTITGQFIGSLPWASPEQAAGESDRTDVRTDIYAIGIILFHILTERFPYDVVGPPSNVLAAIMNAEPTRPSAFRRDIPYDLEQIILKCLSKEPQRRYQSVSELAADLRRFLAREPVLARADSTWYRVTKAVRRHPRVTGVLAGVAALTVLYAAATTVLYRRAILAESDARASTKQADEAASDLEAVYENLLDRIAKLERSPATEAVRRELVAEAYRGLSDLVKKRPGNQPLSASFAATLFRLGDFAFELGQREEALGYLRRAAEIREALVHDQPENLDLRAELSVTTVRIGDMLKELGDVANGQAMYERALAIDQQLALAAPNNAHFLDNLSWSYRRLALLACDREENDVAELYFREELAAARRAVELEPENPIRLDTLFEAQLGQIPVPRFTGLSLNDANIRLTAAKSRAACEPDDVTANEAIRTAQGLVQKARAHSELLAQAMKPCLETARQAAELALNDPHRTRRLIERLRDYAYCAHQAGLDEDANSANERALVLASDLVQADPRVVENLRLLAGLHSWAMERAHEQGDFETALSHAQANLRWLQTALKDAPRDPTLLHQVFLAQHAVGSFLLHVGRAAEAQAAIAASMTIAEQARVAGLMSAEFQRDYGKVLTEPAALTFCDIDRGLDLMAQAIEASQPDDPLSWDHFGNTAFAAGREERACVAYSRSLECIGSGQGRQRILLDAGVRVRDSSGGLF
jgi:tetratricopeptide (TPR) repeat protein